MIQFLRAEFLEARKKLDTHIEKMGCQIRFPPIYNYLDVELANYTQMLHWFETQAYKYRNWNPPIKRIEGKSGDKLLASFTLNNDKIEFKK
jgi:hypothetical protein